MNEDINGLVCDHCGIKTIKPTFVKNFFYVMEFTEISKKDEIILWTRNEMLKLLETSIKNKNTDGEMIICMDCKNKLRGMVFND